MNTDPEQPDVEQEILERAVEAVAKETGLRITITARGAFAQQHPLTYGNPTLCIDDVEYVVEVKRWAQHAPLGAVVEMVKRHPKGVLVADYVNPVMAQRLRAQGVNFIDTAGNAFVSTSFHHVLIKGNRKPETLAQPGIPRKHRGFTAAGLRVTYAFLCRPELVNAPYREIAQAAAVALGTVGKVIEDLSNAGLLVERDDGRRLIRQEELLRTWVERYPAMLRHKLQLGYFQAAAWDWWAGFPIGEVGGLWGGEIAGAHYTQYLTPAVATIYLPKGALRHLITKARLRKLAQPTFDPGMVEVLLPFWTLDPTDGPYVHPILAYADLIATDDPRNLEVARKLYDERIARHLA
jgi:hypothetical protein